MPKILHFIFMVLFSVTSAQKNFELKNVKDFLADDYGNIYVSKNQDFSFIKYDSIGRQIGKIMLVVPFRVQSVQNPLNIVLFSENAQELKFIDQNLNEIQKIEFGQKFGFIRAAYAEDLQKVWLLDEPRKLLLYYNFRDDVLMNSFPVNFSLENILDILVYDDKLYVLRENLFEIYNFNSEKIAEFQIHKGKRLSRENDEVYVISAQEIFKISLPDQFKKVFESKDAKIVDKNHLHFLALIADKFYLYKIK